MSDTFGGNDESIRPDVAVYWFGNWHVDPRMEAWLSKPGWTEWELVRDGTPRFEGHKQPIVPLWGYTDDANLEHAQRACDAAVDAGIDAFMVDWYWYDGPLLQRPLDEALLKVDTDLKFALMWANHDWWDVFPAENVPLDVFAPASVDLATFETLTQHVIDNYLGHPRYWRVNGALYYSIFKIDDLVNDLGGVESARRAFDEFRGRVREAGLGELHLAAVASEFEQGPESSYMLERLGINSVNEYSWIKYIHGAPTVSYAEWSERAQAAWDEESVRYDVPFTPTVSVGWDSTPRTPKGSDVRDADWPFLPVVVDNTPAELESTMRAAVAWAEQRDAPYVAINAWNEWTEGSALEPDNHWGSSKLEAVKSVLRPGPPIDHA
ncbi:glycoside hydrolase family 99-like domain-containing protein [Streptomyces sp. CA-106131]|uniref:glycoside hydrolase family 99-like domain-containing protein n=1 Tax=Streptomyces sp. CA-106131 TaxID=3240045 RepID=UPI003D8A4F6D